MTTAPKLVTGQIFAEGQPHDVTGFPILVRYKGDFTSGTSRALVDLLAEDGVIHQNVHVLAYEMLGVSVKVFSTWSDAGLWNLADTDWHGYGARALAELAKRELWAAEARRAEHQVRLARYQRSADALLGR